MTPFRVGLLVLISGALLFVFLTFSREGGLSESESIPVHAYFRDASGLGPKSRIQIAGIPVGEVTEITLEGTRAKVFMRIRRNVELKVDAILTKRSESLLGDYLLDLNPGTPGAAPMPDHGEIQKVRDQQGMEAIFASLEGIAGDVKEVTASLRGVVGGEKGQASLQQIVDNVVNLTGAVDETVRRTSTQLDDILANVQDISSDVRGVTSRQDENLERIIENIRVVTEDTRAVMASVREITGVEQTGDLKDSVASLKDTLNKLNGTIDNLEQITTKVREGKGVAGVLLSDERVGQKLAETVDDAADLVSSVTQLKTEIGLRTEYLAAQGSAKNTFTLRLVPQPDKYYILEAVDDPRGTVELEEVQLTPPGAGEPQTQIRRVTRETLKLNAQVAKRFYFTTFRFGVTENTGGVGTDFHFFDDALEFKVDAFNFSVDALRYPRLRATARLHLFDHLVITGGMDDILNDPFRDATTNRLLAGRDFFLGGGIYFTDEDLKGILPFVPSL